MFAGCTVALVTPFRDGEVDYRALRGSVDWHVAQGTPTLSPVGTTGESPTLTHDEHERVIATVVERAAGRAKVLPGTGSNATAEAVRLTRFAAKAGADGALLVAPYYNRPTQEGSTPTSPGSPRASTCPWSSTTSRPGPAGTSSRRRRAAGRLGPIVAIKEASGSLDQVSDLLARTDLTVLSGDDSLTLPMLAVGAEGVVSVVANLVPRDVIALIDAFERGDLAEARRLHAPPLPALPRPARAGHQPDPRQAGPGPAGPRQRRAPAAPLPARRAGPRRPAPQPGALRPLDGLPP